jgi:hypothetical protein
MESKEPRPPQAAGVFPLCSAATRRLKLNSPEQWLHHGRLTAPKA